MNVMNPDQILKETNSKMGKAVEYVLHEFSTIHTGKASPSMVENLKVNAYGSMMQIREVAAITTPDARMIQIQPWDKGVMQEVAKAIREANIGLNPIVDAGLIRCPVPELSGERRKELVKTTHTMAEDGKIRVRGIRRDSMDALKKAQKEGILSEDDFKRMEKDVQKFTDSHIKDIDAHLVHKEKELMQI